VTKLWWQISKFLPFLVGHYAFYHRSSKNTTGLAAAAQKEAVTGKPTRSGGTRCIPNLYLALTNLWKLEPAFKRHFAEVSFLVSNIPNIISEYFQRMSSAPTKVSAKARGFLKHLKSDEFIGRAAMVTDITFRMKCLSLLLQRNKCTLPECLELVENAIASLEKLKTK
jgi:hypothetical protein